MIDAGKPGDQPASQQREATLAVARDACLAVCRLQDSLDGGLDRALDATEPEVVVEREMAGGAVFVVEPLQSEGEQRQRVLGATRLDIGEARRGARRGQGDRPRGVPVPRPGGDRQERFRFSEGRELIPPLLDAVGAVTRPNALAMAVTATDLTARLDGPTALGELRRAISDVCRWYP